MIEKIWIKRQRKASQEKVMQQVRQTARKGEEC